MAELFKPDGKEKQRDIELLISVNFRNSDEITDIITAIPSLIVRSGTLIISIIIFCLIIMSACIQYPDVVKTTLKVTSMNSPKSVISNQSGKLITILIHEGQKVGKDEPLAYLESTGIHEDVLELEVALTKLRSELLSNYNIPVSNFHPKTGNLGELQGVYQVFYQSYIQFIATTDNGHYNKQKEYLQRDIIEIGKLKSQILRQQVIRRQELANIQQEYEAYQKLANKGVISPNEFKQEENKYLAGKYPLEESNTSLLNNNSALLSKQKEILDLENTISEQKTKFMQALNVLVNDIDIWVLKYVIKAPVSGRVMLAGPLQANQNVNSQQELFIINPGNNTFYGQLQIPQDNMGKIRLGQRTLIKLRSYPFEQFGLIDGKVSYISDVAYKDSIFIAKIEFTKLENKDPDHKITLKNGMVADAEIITRSGSLLQRFTRSVTKMMYSDY